MFAHLPGCIAQALSVCFFQAGDGIRDFHVTGVQTCALPISWARWAGAYPALSAFVWSSRLASWEPARIELAAKAWSHQLAEAGAGTPAAPPWIWRLTFGPPQGAEAPAGNGREGTEAGRRHEEVPPPVAGPAARWWPPSPLW